MSQRVLTAHVPTALAKEVDALAKRLDRPRGWIVQEALELLVKLERKRYELTLEALAEVERGDTVEHHEIEAWAAELTRKQAKRSR